MNANRSTTPATLVLVTDQFSCERIIKAARVITDLSRTSLCVLSVLKSDVQANPAALEHLFGVAKEYNAVMTVAFSDTPLDEIVAFIRQNRVINAVTGIPDNKNSILVRMWKTQLQVSFFTVTHEGELLEVIDREFHGKKTQAAVEKYIAGEFCLQEG